MAGITLQPERGGKHKIKGGFDLNNRIITAAIFLILCHMLIWMSGMPAGVFAAETAGGDIDENGYLYNHGYRNDYYGISFNGLEQWGTITGKSDFGEKQSVKFPVILKYLGSAPGAVNLFSLAVDEMPRNINARENIDTMLATYEKLYYAPYKDKEGFEVAKTISEETIGGKYGKSLTVTHTGDMEMVQKFHIIPLEGSRYIVIMLTINDDAVMESALGIIQSMKID